MNAQNCSPRRTFPTLQRGQTIFLAAILMLFGISVAIYVMADASSMAVANRQAEYDARILAQVKEALIGWSAARAPTASNPHARPGELPCPDTDNNGFAENDDNNNGIDNDAGETSCVAGAIGRVPWKTLGIPEPKDSAGETLWYAVSGNFRVYRSTSPNAYTSPITSDTLGTLQVYQESTANEITPQAVAVVFAPGAALGLQDRSTSTTMSCAAPSGTYFRYQCASNYLESLGGINNAAVGGPYIHGQRTSTFNDRLLAITSADLMPLVEQRVARELISYLNQYRAVTGVYPWGDLGNGDSNGVEDNNAYNRNRFPCAAALPTAWGSGGTWSLPNWLKNGCDPSNLPLTGWAAVIYYAVARNRLQNSGSGCTTCCGTFGNPACVTANSLTVRNSTSSTAFQCTTNASPSCTFGVITEGGADLVILMPGGYMNSDLPFTRIWSQTGWSTITGYFYDTNNTVSTENLDNDNDTFRVPTSTAHNRVRMYVVR